jgi:fused signal recognition particle receptor
VTALSDDVDPLGEDVLDAPEPQSPVPYAYAPPPAAAVEPAPPPEPEVASAAEPAPEAAAEPEPAAEPEAVSAGLVIPEGQPGWLADILHSLHDRISKLEGNG